MRPPADIGDFDELFRTVITELDVDQREIMEILGTVSNTYSESDEMNADVGETLDILISQSYREAVRRDRNREEYGTKSAEDDLRKKKGGILKGEYPNADPDKWIATCEERFCDFDRLLMDKKVDQVICPVCSGKLWIEPKR